MYVIAVYDVNEKRVAKMLKTFRKYLHWIQNSVFEGELSEVQLKQLQSDVLKIINNQQDSVIFFTSNSEKWLHKKIIGLEKNTIDNFI